MLKGFFKLLGVSSTKQKAQILISFINFFEIETYKFKLDILWITLESKTQQCHLQLKDYND